MGLCLKGIKAIYFGHFFESHIFPDSCTYEINFFLLFYVGLILRYAKKKKKCDSPGNFSSCSIFDPCESRLMKKQILLTVPGTHFLSLRSLEKEGPVAESLKGMSPGRRYEGSILFPGAM